MFREELDKIRVAENEADRRLAETERTVKKMKEEAEMRNRESLEEAKKTAAQIREKEKAEAEEKAAAFKEEAARKVSLEVENIQADAEKRMSDALLLIMEGVKKHGSR